MTRTALQRRAARALERQLDYQRKKSTAVLGREAEILQREIHGEADIVAAAKNELPLGLMHEAGA